MVAKALTAELLSIVQGAPLERDSASLDDLLKVEAPMTSPGKQLSACCRAVISSRQSAIIAGYSEENCRLLHTRNNIESLDTEQV